MSHAHDDWISLLAERFEGLEKGALLAERFEGLEKGAGEGLGKAGPLGPAPASCQAWGMRRTPQQMMAYALEIDEALLPFAGELLADLDELGSDADDIVAVLRSLDLGAETRLVDLGCGKGAVALEIAEALGWRVHGVDLYAAFIDEATEEAERRGLSERCTFSVGDIVELSQQQSTQSVATGSFEVVVMAALGDVLGSWEDTVGLLRRWVPPGGLIVISDGYLRSPGAEIFPGFENYLGREAMIERLTSQGDRMLTVMVDDEHSDNEDDSEPRPLGQPSPAEDAPSDTELIRRRAEQLAARFPERRAEFKEFVRSQAAECDFLEEHFVDAVWVLRRGA